MSPGIAPKTAALPVPCGAQPRHMFVFGAGFVGRYVSERLLAQGCLAGLRDVHHCHQEEGARDAGHECFCFRCHRKQPGKYSQFATSNSLAHLQYAVDEDLRRILSHCNLEWLCYLSSTSEQPP